MAAEAVAAKAKAEAERLAAKRVVAENAVADREEFGRIRPEATKERPPPRPRKTMKTIVNMIQKTPKKTIKK